MSKPKKPNGTKRPNRGVKGPKAAIQKTYTRKRRLTKRYGSLIDTSNGNFKDRIKGIEKECLDRNRAELQAFIKKNGIPTIHTATNKMKVGSLDILLDLLYKRYSNVCDLGLYSGEELLPEGLELPRHYVVSIPLLWYDPEGVVIEYNFEHGCQKDCEVKTNNSTGPNGTYANISAALDAYGAKSRSHINLGIEHVYSGTLSKPIKGAVNLLKECGDVHFMGVIQIWERVRMCQSYDEDKSDACLAGKMHILNCVRNTGEFKKRYSGKNPIFLGAQGAEKLRKINTGGK